MTPATVPDAYPPRPLVTSHSRRGGRSPALTVSSTRSRGSSMRLSSCIPVLPRLRREQQRACPWDHPARVGLDLRRALSSVFGRLAAPGKMPAPAERRRDERLARRREIEVGAEIDDEQSIAVL